ncbi:MAG: hypothetical protein LBB45_02470 [Methanobrevibacter sp.]|jgi:hypothetical protein|nr:hypothetical protein [Candidatus Methanovirga basalitermitum]
MYFNDIIFLYAQNGEHIASILLIVLSIFEFVQVWGNLRGKNDHEMNFYIPLVFLIQASFTIYGFIYEDVFITSVNLFGLIFTPLTLFTIFYYGFKSV